LTLRLYNTLTRGKQEFVPLDPANVRIYVCGPTVYDFAHIGNARPVIVFDVLFRLLRHLAQQGEWDGGKGETKVTYVRNITDVDDKIIRRAREDFPGMPLNEAITRVTSETERQFHEDVAALGCLEPTHEPRATGHVPQMVRMIETLIEKGHAYPTDGHVLFAVGTFGDYGRLARRSTDEMIAGARVEVVPYKRDPMDFVLWKPSAPGEPGWESPWGRGRPGWHIECSAMSDHWLWEQAKPSLTKAGLGHPHMFDIHGGGIDLVFPHHENEIAQSRCAHGTDIMANIWMHNGFLQVEGRKMAKSEGNFVTIRELLGKWPGEVLRFNMLRTHYHQPIDWTRASLEQSHSILFGWKERLLGQGMSFLQKANLKTYAGYGVSDFVVTALTDDLNTPAAIAELHSLSRVEGHTAPDEFKAFYGTLRWLGLLDDKKMADFERQTEARVSDPIVEQLKTARDEARRRKDFAEADRIRDELIGRGFRVMDSPDGTKVEVAR